MTRAQWTDAMLEYVAQLLVDQRRNCHYGDSGLTLSRTHLSDGPYIFLLSSEVTHHEPIRLQHFKVQLELQVPLANQRV
jgi:hypothetical protein